MATQTFDTVIIGFGKGGKTLAQFLGNQGLQVAVVEKSKEMYGGTCINIACIPTKALALAASHAASHHPATMEEKQAFYERAIEQKRKLVSGLRQKNYANLANNPNIQVIDGTASFLSPHEVKVVLSDSGETTTFQAENIIINTGTVPYIPLIAGLEESKRAYTSTSLMELMQLPERMIVIGSGYVGLEFASIYRAFGTQVTVLDQRGVFLAGQDRDIASLVQQTMEKQGIEFRLNATVTRVEDRGAETYVRFNDENGAEQELAGDAVLVAVGRAPVSPILDLDKVGVEANERGFIKVDEHVKTTTPNVWVLGDANGGPQFTYVSLDDYRIVRDQFFGNGKRSLNTRHYVPYSIFIYPTLSRVGLTEEEALEQGYEIKVGKLPAAASTRAQMMGETDGLLKAVVDARTDKILGCTLYCIESNEIIGIVEIAMQAQMNYQALRDNIFTHPSVAESLNDLFSQIR